VVGHRRSAAGLCNGQLIDCEYSTLERLTPTKHGRLRRVILEVYATTAHSVVFPRSQQLGLTTRFGMSLWRGELPVDSGRVLPTGWAEAGGANRPQGIGVMSSLTGRVRLPRVTVLSVVVGLVCGGRRWAPRRAPWRLVAGCRGRLPGLSERRRGAPGNGQLLDGQRSSGSGRSPFPVGGVWPADDWGAESAAPRAREEAREAVRVR